MPAKASFKSAELNTDGEYRVIVFSNQSGPFTLRAVAAGGPAEELTEAGLLKRIKELEQELERLRAKLKELKGKK